ncbi:ABC transporter permease subunit [Rhizobium sp. CSW-27]|uniref:ABC transporter permease n=1 Tax=Rhizobium sp. CSW-27 TaxID=2839985 RepID=UPI001C01CA0A|nr:ABC transporter permease subunit [Rhizobium sp. CSW-27]MBT9370014.1 ABC transporter permease subunit [Rhizobium sp. CSW-27]
MTLERWILRLRALISFLLVVAIWQLVAWLEFVPRKYFPTIPEVAAGFWSMLMSGELIAGDALTLTRAIIGIAGASIIGVALALLAEISPTFKAGFRPIAALIQPIPPAALVPMAIFMLGLGFKLYAFIIILVTIWPPYLNGAAALSAVSDVQVKTGRMLGLSDREILLTIKLPAAWPEIFSGIRYAATISLIAVVVAEMLAGRDGLGFMLIRKAFAMRIPEVYALMFVCALNCVVINMVVNLARRKIAGWHMQMTERTA